MAKTVLNKKKQKKVYQFKKKLELYLGLKEQFEQDKQSFLDARKKIKSYYGFIALDFIESQTRL
jgi:hypothetical protein